MKRGRKCGIVIGILLLIGLFFFLWKCCNHKGPDFTQARQIESAYSAGWTKYPLKQEPMDWEQVEGETYNSLVLTSYRCRQFNLDALEWGFGVEPLQIVWETGSADEICASLDQAAEALEHVDLVFLELDPRRHNDTDLVNQIQSQEDTKFFIFFTPYPADYWKRMEQNEGLEDRLLEYGQLAAALTGLDNVLLFYFDDQEWMTCNPYYFADGKQMSEGGIYQIFSAFGAKSFLLTTEEMNSGARTLQPFSEKKDYTALKGQTIFCFGDSMFGKDKNESGVIEVAGGFVNAQVYNAAISGSSASGKKISDLTGTMDLLLNWEEEKDKLLQEEYQEQIPPFTVSELERMQGVTPDYIILGYGYNDYSQGAYPYEGGSDGQVSFADSLHTNIQRLKEAYPEAKIILSTAVTSSRNLELEYPLWMYADATKQVAEKEQIFCLYNYETEELVSANLDWLLLDGVHFSVAGRFLQAGRIASLLEEIGEPVVPKAVLGD